MEFNKGTGVVKLFKCFVSSKEEEKGGGEEGFFSGGGVGWEAGVVLYCFVFLTLISFWKLPLVTRTPGIITVNLGPKNAEFEIARRAMQKSCNTMLGPYTIGIQTYMHSLFIHLFTQPMSTDHLLSSKVLCQASVIFHEWAILVLALMKYTAQ